MAVTAVTAAVSYGATAFATTAVASVIGAGIVASAVGAVVGGVAAGLVGGAIAGHGSPAPSQVGSQQARGMLLNAASSIDPLPVIYGSRRVGGTYVIPPSVSGASNEYLHLVIALCEGEISAINTVYLDDVASDNARYTGLVTIEKFTGSDTQAASAALIAAIPGWTSAHQGKGVAYVHVRIQYDQNAFHGIPVVTCDVDGKRVYDPADTTTKFSNNPALCIRDYLTSTRYGRGIPSAMLDDATFISAATHCAASVAIPGGTQARYTLDGSVNVDDTVYANIQRLLSSCRGMLIFSGGKYKLVIDKAETPQAFTFNEDNITGAWEFHRPGKRDKANKVSASFFNPANNWQPDLAIQDSATYLAQDNGLLLERKIDLPYTANLYRAQHLAQLEMKSTRFGMVVRFSAFQEGLRCEVGDVVPITHGTPGWTAKPFRIMTIDIMDFDNVEITAREYDAAAYTLDDLAAVSTAPATNLPDPFTVSAPTGLALSSGTSELIRMGDGTIVSRIKVAWTTPSDASIREAQLQFKPSAASDWIAVPPVKGALGPAWLQPVLDGTSYDVRLRYENAIGARSSWTVSTNHVVVGKITPPADATGFSASQNGDVVVYRWNLGTEADLAGSEIRYVAKGGKWENGTPVTKTTRGTQITTAAVPPGSWTHMIKFVDSSGNFSVNEARFDLDVANTFNLVYQENEAPVWHGTLTGLVRHWTGVLVPQSQNLASADGWDTFNILVPNPVAVCEYEHAEIDFGFDADLRAWNNVDARIPQTGSGMAEVTPQIDYRLAAGAYDGYEPWTVGQVRVRYAKMKLAVDTSLGTPVLHGFTPTLDVKELRQTFLATIAAGGTAITWPQRYHSAPRVGATALGTGGLIAVIDPATITATGATAHVFNTSNADVGGQITVDVTGA